MVRHTQPSEVDPLDSSRAVQRVRAVVPDVIGPVVAQYKGRVVKLMGDGVLVEFSSVVDAVECALAIQHRIAEQVAGLPETRRITFRIGVNLGDIIADADDIYGDGVNVASRLEELAGPGEVYVSGTVHDHAAGKLTASFEDLGEHEVKNIEQPVRVYRARASSAPDKQRIYVLGTPGHRYPTSRPSPSSRSRI